MDKDRIKGKVKDVAGRIERQAGEWTDDEEAQAKGLGKQAEGKAQNIVGRVKDKVRDVASEAERRSQSDKKKTVTVEEDIETQRRTKIKRPRRAA